MSSNTAEWLTQQINEQLVGATIVGAAITPDDDGIDPVPGLVVRKGNLQFIVWVLSDPEGNGDGFLEIDKSQAQFIKNTPTKVAS